MIRPQLISHHLACQTEQNPDLNDKNIMLGLVPGALDQGPTPSERYKQIGRPKKFPLPECSFVWRPGQLVAGLTWPAHMVAKTAFVGDFGLTKKASSPLLDDNRQPEEFRPPELFHEGFEPTYGSDMWSFMCVFHALITGDGPFFGGWYEHGVLGSMASTLGPLPPEWEGHYKWPKYYSDEERQKWYDQDRALVVSRTLESYVDDGRPDLAGSRERELILEVMRKGFRYKPEERITAQGLLNDASFVELMAMYGIE